MAMGVNKNRVVRKHRSLNNLTLLNVACPVCMGILIEPVTLPCNHDLCLECFEKSVENNSLTCPMCRKRIGGWLRQAKDKSLVNQTLWKLIQEKFPHEVEAKLKGDDDGVADRISAMIPPVSLSSEGEIREEFALEVKKYEEEIRRKQEEEQNASLELIRKLQEEEERKRLEATKLLTEDEEIARKVQESVKQEEILEMERRKRQQAAEDEKIARQLQEQMMVEHSEVLKPKSAKKEIKHSPSTSGTAYVKGPMDSFVYQVKQGTPDNTKDSKCKMKPFGREKRSRSRSSDSIDSEDSIKQELVHFKPIRIVPRTPPKKMPDGRVFEPRVIVASPLGINDLCRAVRRGSNLNPTARKLAENFMKMQKRPYECTITPPTEGRISKSVGTNQSSAFKGRDFIRKLDPYNAQLERSELTSGPERKKLCTDTKGFDHSTAVSGFSSTGSANRPAPQATDIANTTISTFVSSLDSAVSPVEVCRAAEEEDLQMPDISHVACSYGGSCESPAKTSTDSGKISLCEEDSTKMHFTNEAPKKIADGEKRVNEALIYHNKKNENSLTVNNNNNVEVETESRDDAVCDSGIEDERVVIEQARIEQQIRQEQEDLQLAMELQRKWDMESRIVDRRKGTSRAYELRSTSISETVTKKGKSVVNKGARQRTLQEAFHRGNQRLIAHSGH
ncbi:E3 ubiquitin-protein ligase RNF169-like [Schistocerca americana]|uniref:E3 ubiquitin-protein ligase RNF169-like n=1 Tax=Schistocerca americana TaxID=7009 RepID=UPI001F4F1178|nr:E3 ubiquitin-protein ligase RNF169-like [Schistocerca americana]XP_049951412.1 E3 ubiquitin-protein ligase RNF169-like [Schistocerca serialis cubense]